MVTAKKSNRKDIEAIYPLSPMQQGMLFHSLYNQESKAYLSQIRITFNGNLNISAFEQAWQFLVERHPVLRTVFVWSNPKKPLQVVRKQASLPWVNLDWRSLSGEIQQQRLQEFCESDRNQYFQLEKGPLMRFTLIRMAEKSYELIWSSHHILMDGWSDSVLMQEFLQFYQALQQGEEIYLPATRPYKDYITWLQQQDVSQAEAYWKQTLQGFNAPTPLVVDKVKTQSSQPSESYEHQYFYLSATATATLKNFVQEHRLTAFTLIQAAWGLLLSRYSGELDVVFGATVSGRPPDLVGVESMVGLFVNTLPVRLQVEENTDIINWLQKIQTQQIERDRYSWSPLVEIQGWSDVPRGQSLFESFVVFENLPVAQESSEISDGLQIVSTTDTGHADYPLIVRVLPTEELTLKFIYASDRFSADTIKRMAGHFETLLMGIVNCPHHQPLKLPILTDTEKQLLLVDWNQTQAENPLKQGIHELVAAQVEKTPTTIAIVQDNQKLTYQELNQRANQLAHYLQRLGVEADVPVGVCLERSLDFAIAILGILKAGGACVPLDPSYPQERLALMLQDCGLKVLLTQEHLESLLPSDVPHQRILLEQQWEQINLESPTNPQTQVSESNLAYIVYSSGSTGVPKGIAVPHRSITNLIEYHLAEMPGGNVLQFAPLSFDVSYHEIFAAWCLGGTLYMVPEETRLDLEKLIQLLTNNPINKAIFPVSLLQQLAEIYGSQPQLFQNLRSVIAAGEQLQITQPTIDLFKQLENCRLYNFYGPTEADLVTAYAFSANPEEWPLYAPIGKPAVNVQVYILDKYLQQVSVGVPGELHVSGAGLAREYLNRGELTSEKFIPHPFSQQESAKIYKTGDLARYLPDGNIEYLGRIDGMVKIRGYRVDLGEVEAVLSKHPQISQAVTTVHGESAKEKYLAAYFIPIIGQTINASDLRQFLAAQLSEHMIPSAFVQMDSFPLSPNGKVNRRLLTPPDNERPELSQSYIAPSTPTEEILAEIWVEVLGVKKVGINDNFFQLGGHSLKAIQLISRIRQTFELEVTIRDLFSHPTVKELATATAAIAGGEEIIDEISRTLQEIAQLSPEEVQGMLSQE